MKMDLMTHSLKSWKLGVGANGEPVLILELIDGQTFGVMMPGQTAVEMGTALVDIGAKATPTPALRN